MATKADEIENFCKWRHFLSSLQKAKRRSSPKKQKDVFLGEIDCFSTKLSRKLLGKSGESIKAKVSPSSSKKLHDHLKSRTVSIKDTAGDEGVCVGLKRKHSLDVNDKSQNKNIVFSERPASPTDEHKVVTEKRADEKGISSGALQRTEEKGISSDALQRTEEKGISSDALQRTDEKGISSEALQRTDEKGISSDALQRTDEKGISSDALQRTDGKGISSDALQENMSKSKSTEDMQIKFQKKNEIQKEVEKMDDDDIEWSKGKNFSKGLSNGNGELLSSGTEQKNDTKSHCRDRRKDDDAGMPEAVDIQSEVSLIEDKQQVLIPSTAISLIDENIVTERKRHRFMNFNKQKVDVDIPCCKWTLEMLARYVDFEESVGKINLKEEYAPYVVDRLVEKTMKQIKMFRKVVCPPDTVSSNCIEIDVQHSNAYDLSRIHGTEADARVILDAFLIPFAAEFGLHIETEKSYENKNLPHCQFDYRIKHHGDVIGLVEAKRRIPGNTLGAEHVVQGIVQLAALQAEVYGKRNDKLHGDLDLIPIPLFNIVSDGYQFIFIQLEHQKLLFDHQPGRNVYGESKSTIKFDVVNSRNGMHTVLTKLVRLLFQFEQSIAKEMENGDEDELDSDDEELECYETEEDGTIILD